MQKKIFTLINRGMNRDTSISKAGESSAYENHNIRILSRDNDTMLSITNERGNKQIPLDSSIAGTVIGWNVLNEHLIIFTHEETGDRKDHIYRVDYVRDYDPNSAGSSDPDEFEIIEKYNGNLNFDAQHPIESIVYLESEKVQKIYWVDGKNVLRMMNFMAEEDEMKRWNDDYFDSNRSVTMKLHVDITKDNAGNARPNGVVQYLITYYNKYSQETGYAWISDLIYLSPTNAGGSPDSTNTNRVTLDISNLDEIFVETVGQDEVWTSRFTNLNVYAIFRSSYNGTVSAYLIDNRDLPDEIIGTDDPHVIVIDDGSHQAAVDPTELLYLGSHDVRPGTMTHKDQTLFLGDLECKDLDLTELGNAIKYTANGGGMFTDGTTDPETGDPVIVDFVDGETWQAGCVKFVYSDGTSDRKHIPYVANTGAYPYENQLVSSSSIITTFKGGEKYRFGLMFRSKNGVNTQTFWIGDLVNYRYPVTDETNKVVKRAIAYCLIPVHVMEVAYSLGLGSVQLMIAEATYADRSIKAQGLINPTVFNVWNRYNNRLYASTSWVSRPRRSGYACDHFEVIHKSNLTTGEIQCNYWETEATPNPYYQIKDYNTEAKDYVETFDGTPDCDVTMIIYCVWRTSFLDSYIHSSAYVIRAKLSTPQDIDYLNNYSFSGSDFPGFGQEKVIEEQNGRYTIVIGQTGDCVAGGPFTDLEVKIKSIWEQVNRQLQSLYDVTEDQMLVYYDTFDDWAYRTWSEISTFYYNELFPAAVADAQSSAADAANYNGQSGTDNKWYNESGLNEPTSESERPSYYKKHLMFVDENVVTLDSPEITYEAVSFDNTTDLKLRVIGVSKVSSNTSDEVVEASHGMLPGQNFVNENLSGTGKDAYLDGITAWPLWDEYGLTPIESIDGDASYVFPEDPKKRTSKNYSKGGGRVVRYWLYMWNHLGQIDEYYNTNKDGSESEQYSLLRKKIFANMKFSYKTSYVYTANRTIGGWTTDLDSLRVFNYTASQYTSINVYNHGVYYDGYVDETLMVPGTFKYPIYYSMSDVNVGDKFILPDCYLYSISPVTLTYGSNPHAVMSLPSVKEREEETDFRIFKQTLLPRMRGDNEITVPERDTTNHITGALIPWFDHESKTYNYLKCDFSNYGLFWNSWIITDNSQNDIISLQLNSGSTVLNFTSLWDDGIDHFGGETYVHLMGKYTPPGETNYRVVYMLVDISGYEVDETGFTYTINNAKCVRYKDGEVETANVNYVGFDPDESGSGVVDILSGDVLPADEYIYTDYVPEVDYNFTLNPSGSNSVNVDSDPEVGEKYFLVGEIYYDYDADAAEDPTSDTRYGGIMENQVANNKFIPASRLYPITSDYAIRNRRELYGTQGDTYFQRFDALRIKPLDKESENGVIDITSAMLETHINIDGRYDLMRGNPHIASLDTEQFGTINRVYSQPNNFIQSRDIDDDLNNDLFRSTITWTLEKHDLAERDEWMHITLANTLNLDGDKGDCTALRRFQNSLIAFQDRGIAEILFNSRTQISTTSGVPIELANSGKVDGKRYITNKYGCANKWSIVEGKAALYFVDNINKMFGSLSEGIDNLSAKLGFSEFFRRANSVNPWTPDKFNNIVSYYDRIHSDVYLIMGNDNNSSENCLVYNEALGAFTSFFDYGGVTLMANLDDRFVSAKKGNANLWLQNEGLYCNFFGTQYNFWVNYRATPDPYGDKIWTNLEYRADVYQVLDVNGGLQTKEDELIDYRYYKANETFDTLTVWDEYQTTGNTNIPKPAVDAYADARKKFRIWRMDIPRAQVDASNIYGFDRIRNPWANIMLKKVVNSANGENRNLMQIHDINAIYFE